MIMRSEQTRSAPLELERGMHKGFGPWSQKHSERYSNIGVLPYRPWLYTDQKIKKASRKISRLAIYLPETAYLKSARKVYARAVGSAALAEQIIDGYHRRIALEGVSVMSIPQYAISCMEEESDDNQYGDKTLGIACGHADRLSDVGDFTSGLSQAVSDIVGTKYVERFKAVVNKNMTRETMKITIGNITIEVPLAWLMAYGFEPYWGMPKGESPKLYGITEEMGDAVDSRMMRQFIADKKKSGVIVTYVPSAKGLEKVVNPVSGKLDKFIMGDASFTRPLTSSCDGGVVVANRYGDDFSISAVLPNIKPEEVSTKIHRQNFMDQVVEESALQIAELSGVPVEYEGKVFLGRIAAANQTTLP